MNARKPISKIDSTLPVSQVRNERSFAELHAGYRSEIAMLLWSLIKVDNTQSRSHRSRIVREFGEYILARHATPPATKRRQ